MKKLICILTFVVFGIVVAQQFQKQEMTGITFIGDSIMHTSKKYISPNFEKSYFDTKIGRQFSTLPGIVRDLKDKGELAPVLVVHLGTNGKFKEADFDEVMFMAGDRQVFFVNTAHKDRWEKEVNQLLEEKVSQYKNAYLLDWYGHAKTKTEYFYKDRTHLKDAGQRYYADFLTSSIKEQLAKNVN